MTTTRTCGKLHPPTHGASATSLLNFLFFGIWQPAPTVHPRSRSGKDFPALSDRIGIWLEGHLRDADGSLIWRDFSLEELAHGTGVSTAELRQLFQLCICSDFRLWKTSRRIAVAKRLIAGGADMEDVARACSYTSITTFTRQFCRAAGCSTEEWLVSFRDGKCSPSEYDVFKGPLE